ncbi:MAG: hypothetical protein ACK54E_16175 [Pseudanabaena sp.]
MKLLNKVFLATLVVCLSSAFSNDSLQAQRKSGGASLAELSCQKFGGTRDFTGRFSQGGYKASNVDVVIGGELLRTFAFLGNNNSAQNYWGIYRNSDLGPERVACRLAPVNGSSEFRTLVLQFGLSDGSDLLDGSVAVRLRLVLDGEYYGEKLITKGDLIRWAIPVTGKRSVALEGACIRPKNGRDNCPNIWFTQDLLTR